MSTIETSTPAVQPSNESHPESRELGKPIWIGNLKIAPPIFQAPMAGYTNYAFRQIVRDYGGAGLQATEMVNASGFVWLDEHDCEHPDRLWGIKDEARPFKFGTTIPTRWPK
jgi:tRNA-dihydrouridine synthase B